MHRKTKIIATLGPSCATPEGIAGLVAAGMDVARLNFSHGTHDTHRLWAEWVRAAAADQGRAVAVLQDIQGPRIRVGTFPGGSIELRRGDELKLCPGDGEANPGTVFVQYLDAADLVPGDRVLLNDGMVEVRVLEAASGEARVEVHQGGRLSDRKGAAFPGIHLDLPAITAKDREDLAFGAEIGVDLVAASFVETADDIAAVREVVGDTPVIAKVERSAAYSNLAGLLAVADGAMVARGDLGVELGYEPLPRIQKEIIAAANSAGRISITATEMLESMISSPRPTRAEVTDVANAVIDGSDAVMLSAETAVGADPIRAVEVMAAICSEAESSPGYLSGHRHDFVGSEQTFASAISLATAETANSLGLGAVVAFTESGSTARLISKYRPRPDILAFTPNEATYRRMALLWGVTPIRFERQDSTDEMIAAAERLLLDRGLLAAGDPVAMVAGIPPNQDASTNLLKLHSMGDATGAG